MRRIKPEHFVEWTRKAKPAASDVILSRRCNPGETAVAPPDLDFALGQNLVLLRADGSKIYPPFLRWLVRGPEWWDQIGKFLNVGAVFDSLRCADVPKFQLRIPPLSAQRSIAHILGTLDDKLDLNRRMSATLESITRSIFNSWLVNFDPVRRKGAYREPSLPEDLAAASPNCDCDSEHGRIPNGWEASSVYELGTFINGAAYRAFDPNDERRGLPIVKIAELKQGITKQTRFSAVEMPGKYRIDNGDILFSWSGNPDTSIATYVWANGPGWLNQHIFRVVPRSPEERAFVLLTLRNLRPVFAEIARNKQTTGLGHVTIADLKRIKIARPPRPILLLANRALEPLLARSLELDLQAKSLAALRDTLLPRLLSGDLDQSRLQQPRTIEGRR